MRRYIYLILGLSLLFWACNNERLSEEQITAILLSKDWQYDVHNIWMEVDQLDLGESKRNSLDQTLDRLKGGYIRFQADSVLIIQPKDKAETRGVWYLVNHGKAIVMRPTINMMPPQLFREISEDGFTLEIDNNSGFFFPKKFIPFAGDE